MDGVRLHRLGKRLIDLAREVTASAGDTTLTPGEEAVLEDVLKHPDSTVSEICARTGFAQSHVSVSVGRLRERGLLETSADLEDRRRTRVRLADVARRAIMRRAARPADEVLAAAAGDSARADRVAVLLDELASLLL